MDKELRKEFREWKAQVDDRLDRLEAEQKAKDVVSSDPAPQPTSSKKAAAEAASFEKDAN